jgi:hypothetical protein
VHNWVTYGATFCAAHLRSTGRDQELIDVIKRWHRMARNWECHTGPTSFSPQAEAEGARSQVRYYLDILERIH